MKGPEKAAQLESPGSDNQYPASWFLFPASSKCAGRARFTFCFLLSGLLAFSFAPGIQQLPEAGRQRRRGAALVLLRLWKKQREITDESSVPVAVTMCLASVCWRLVLILIFSCPGGRKSVPWRDN